MSASCAGCLLAPGCKRLLAKDAAETHTRHALAELTTKFGLAIRELTKIKRESGSGIFAKAVLKVKL